MIVIYPLFVINSSAIRQAYIQNGCNDPYLLNQMSKMQADAQALEDDMKKQQQQKPKGRLTLNCCLLQVVGL